MPGNDSFNKSLNSSLSSSLNIWLDRVDDYVQRLESIADRMDLALGQFKPSEAAADTNRIDAESEKIAEIIAEMETMVAERETLVGDEAAPRFGSTLTEKIQGIPGDSADRLARRCEVITRTIAKAHQRALSLFVCQYHLAELSGEVVGILSGTAVTTTYSPQGNDRGSASGTSASGASSGGGLFNEAG